MTSISTYKSKIASRYMPVPPEHIGLKIMESEYYFASMKYDGHLAILQITDKGAQLFDATGDLLVVPAITDAAATIKGPMLLAGELSCFVKGKPASHREVSAALDEPEKHDLRLALFDVVEHASIQDASSPADKMQLLASISSGEAIFPIAQSKYESRKDLITFFNSLSTDDEGMVVRAANGIVYKVKRSISLDVVVLGYAVASDNHNRLRDLLLGFSLGNDQYQVVAKCGNGFSDSEREAWVKQLEGDAVASDYVEVSGAKTAFVLVKPQQVVEVSCLDLIESTGDGPIQKAILSYTPAQGYLRSGMASTLSLISPVFVRSRTDKQPTAEQAGTQQAYAIKSPVVLKSGSEETASTILRREVFTKTTKGATAVRKFVALQTHKESTGNYSPYVVVYSDFSGGRKTPLEQELFLCGSAKEADEKIEVLKAENIKKGWEAHN